MRRGYRVTVVGYAYFFVFKQKTAYKLRIRDWSSDVCSSDLAAAPGIASNCAAGPDRVCQNSKAKEKVDKSATASQGQNRSGFRRITQQAMMAVAIPGMGSASSGVTTLLVCR